MSAAVDSRPTTCGPSAMNAAASCLRCGCRELGLRRCPAVLVALAVVGVDRHGGGPQHGPAVRADAPAAADLVGERAVAVAAAPDLHAVRLHGGCRVGDHLRQQVSGCAAVRGTGALTAEAVEVVPGLPLHEDPSGPLAVGHVVDLEELQRAAHCHVDAALRQ